MAFNFSLELIYYKKIQNNSSIIAELGIRIVEMNMNLYQLKLIQSKNGGTFVAGPSREYKDPDSGKKKYSPYWTFYREENDEFQRLAKRLIELHIASQQPKQIEIPKDEDIPF